MKKIYQYSLLIFTVVFIALSTKIAYEIVNLVREEGAYISTEFSTHILIYFLIPIPGIFAILFQIRIIRDEYTSNQNEELDTFLIEEKSNTVSAPIIYRASHIIFFLIVFAMGVLIIPNDLAHRMFSEPQQLQIIVFSFFGFTGISYYLDIRSRLVQ